LYGCVTLTASARTKADRPLNEYCNIKVTRLPSARLTAGSPWAFGTAQWQLILSVHQATRHAEGDDGSVMHTVILPRRSGAGLVPLSSTRLTVARSSVLAPSRRFMEPARTFCTRPVPPHIDKKTRPSRLTG
jgi:hypothetical protein